MKRYKISTSPSTVVNYLTQVCLTVVTYAFTCQINTDVMEKSNKLKIAADVGFFFLKIDAMQLQFYFTVIDIGGKRKEVTSYYVRFVC